MNISKPIEIKFTWTKDLALKASKIYYDYDMKHSRKRYIGWIFVALVQFSIVGALKHNVFGMLYLSTLLVGYWYYGRWYLRQNMIIKYYNNLHIDNTEVTFLIDKDGFKSDNNLIKWDEIVKVLKIDKDILVQTTSNTLYFARDSFKCYDDVQTLLSLAKNYNKL